ncbi:HAD family hydrolase [soil metagenome]
MMRQVKAVLFDCDGVLIDSEVIAIGIEVAALAKVGVHLTRAELADRYVGVSGSAMRRSVAKEFDVDLTDAFWNDLRDRSHAELTEEVRPVTGMAEVIERLTVPYCLASSSSHERIELSLEAAGLLHLFPPDLRFSAEDVDHGKPAPDLFLLAARSLGVDPADCVVVEDSPYGVQAALAAEMDVIGFTGGGHADKAWAGRLRTAGATTIVTTADELEAELTPDL